MAEATENTEILIGIIKIKGQVQKKEFSTQTKGKTFFWAFPGE